MTIEEIIESSVGKHKDIPGLTSDLVREVIYQESKGREKAVSKKGAAGIMQLMPATARSLGLREEDIFDPEKNIGAGTELLAQLLTRYKGDVKKALAAYNSNPEAVDKYGGVPPFPETQEYVKNITARLQDKDFAQKGSAIYEGTDPETGGKLRVSIPKNATPDERRAAFQKESQRQKGIKETIKPFRSDPYSFATETLRAAPERAAEQMSPLNTENIYGGQFGTGFGGGDEVTPESLQRGMSGEDIPIVGSLIRAAKGEFSPEEAADWMISVGRGGLGGGLKKATGVRDIAQVGRGLKRGYQEAAATKTPWYRHTLSGLAGMATGSALGMNPYETGIAGAVVGSKAPAFARGFARGVSEPITYPSRLESIGAEPSFAESPSSRRAGYWAGTPSRQIPSAIDIRTESGAYPMPSGPPQVLPEAPEIPRLSAGPAKVSQMPPASEVPIYGGKRGLAKSRESGMYVPRQRKLPLYQEGSNIPGTIPEFKVPPSETMSAEQIGQKLVPNIRRESIAKAGEERQPQPTSKQLEKAEEKPKPAEVKEMPKKTKNVVLPSTVKEHARIHGMSVEEAEKYYRDQGYEIRKRSLKKKD